MALIKLKGEVDLSGPYRGLACMPKETDDYHGAEDCWLSGWGLTMKGITGGVLPPSQLQVSGGGSGKFKGGREGTSVNAKRAAGV